MAGRGLMAAIAVVFSCSLLYSAYAGEFCAINGRDPTIAQATSSETSRLFIQGGTVVNADRQQLAHVYIEDGIIKAVGPHLQAPEGSRIIDASGKFVMPGGIDPHTHMAMPFMGTESCDDFFSGQSAALAGGTTMHIDFVLPAGHDLAAGFAAWQAKAELAAMDYGFHMAVTSWSEKVKADMTDLVAKGINSFKFFLAYKGALQVSDEELLQGLQHCKDLGALPQVHAENGDAVEVGRAKVFGLGITGPEGHALSRPPVLEGEATGRAIRLAAFVNVPLYVVHVMSIDALEEIARARQAGQRVVGEPVASGLALDESHLWDKNFTYAAQFVMSPPIRGVRHQAALRAALANGVLQLVATDHCPFNSTQKAAGKKDFRLIPNGVNGVEERMHVVWDTMVNSGMMSASDFVRVTSTACAQLFNIYPQKGIIAPGSDADVIILNPNATFTVHVSSHHSRIDTNIYENRPFKGKVEVTISRGRVVWEDGQLSVTQGSGRFIPMKPFGPLYDGLGKVDEANLASYRAPTAG